MLDDDSWKGEHLIRSVKKDRAAQAAKQAHRQKRYVERSIHKTPRSEIEERRRQIVWMVEQGWSGRVICKKLGITANQLKADKKKLGLSRRRRGKYGG